MSEAAPEGQGQLTVRLELCFLFKETEVSCSVAALHSSGLADTVPGPTCFMSIRSHTEWLLEAGGSRMDAPKGEHQVRGADKESGHPASFPSVITGMNHQRSARASARTQWLLKSGSGLSLPAAQQGQPISMAQH